MQNCSMYCDLVDLVDLVVVAAAADAFDSPSACPFLNFAVDRRR